MTRRRFSAKALMSRLLEFSGKCAECDCKVGGTAGMEWDHIIPLEMGGEDKIDNLQPLCRPCHKAKTKQDAGHIAKAKRMRQRRAGIARQPRAVIPGSKASRWRRKIDGTIERRGDG